MLGNGWSYDRTGIGVHVRRIADVSWRAFPGARSSMCGSM